MVLTHPFWQMQRFRGTVLGALEQRAISFASFLIVIPHEPNVVNVSLFQSNHGCDRSLNFVRCLRHARLRQSNTTWPKSE